MSVEQVYVRGVQIMNDISIVLFRDAEADAIARDTWPL